ncbi:MAG: hypothetical protein K8H84_07860 [Sulfuricella denitrificans]|nr:hypothetical protein [Sulfuricella denitrificans]
MDTTTTDSNWAGWIQATLGAVIGAAANKEFAPQGLQTYQTFQVDAYGRVIPNGQPVTAPTPATQANNLLIIGGLALVAVMLLK